MRFLHNLTENNTVKRVVSFLLMLCLLVPMLPSSIGLDAKADDDTTKDTTASTGDTVTITLHDLYIDRKEALPDGTKLDNCLLAYESARTITVEKGTTLAAAFEKKADDSNLQLGTKSLVDTGVYKTGTEDKNAMTSVANAKDCVWYTRDDSVDNGGNGGVDGNGTRTKVTGDTVIDKDTDLFTYSYRIRLITANSGDGRYKDLIVREGHTNGFVYGVTDNKDDTSISKFLSENSVDNTWTDVNDDKKVDTSILTTDNGITRNYAFRAYSVKVSTRDISYYVAVNGEWKKIKTVPMDTDRVDVWGRTGPALNYYVTDSELKTVYKDYGFGTDIKFQAGKIDSTINGYFPFRNGNSNNDTLHIRQMPKQVEGGTEFRVPLIEDTTEIADGGLAIYYTPHNTTEYTSNFLAYEGNDKNKTGRDRYGWASVSDSAVLKENSFYTVSVDEADKVNFDSSRLPDENKKYLYGSKVEFKLPLTDKDNTVQWYVEKGGDNVTITDNKDDTATVTIDSIDSQLILTTDETKEYAGDVKIHCYVLVDGKPQEVGELHTHATSKANWGQDKYYVTAKQAAIVYGTYGFDVSKFDPSTNKQQTYIFANTKHTDTTIWMDLAPYDSGDGMGYKIPLLSSNLGENNMDLYYVPNNKTTEKSSASVTDATSSFCKTNSFYSVTVKDEATKFQGYTLPEKQYVLYGGTAKITVPASESATWSIWNCLLDGNPVNEHSKDDISSSSANGQITYTVNNICRPILVTTSTDHEEVFDTDNYVKIIPYISIDGEWVETGNDIQGIDKTHVCTVNNNNKYYITAEELENIYGQYGFDASNVLTTEKLHQIGCRAGTDPNIWADNTPKQSDSSWVLPLATTDKTEIQLYYLPKNTGTDKNDRNEAAAQNTFHSVEVTDTGGNFSADQLLGKKYYLTGTDVSLKLPYKKDVPWTCVSGDIAIRDKFPEHDGGYISIKIDKIDHSVKYTTEDVKKDVTVYCYIFLNQEKFEVATVSFDKKNYQAKWNADRYYITANNLATIYGKYGFDVSKYKPDGTSISNSQNLYFPTAVHDGEKNDEWNCPGTLWADTYPKDDNDGIGYKIPLTKVDSKFLNIDLYYTPNNSQEHLGKAKDSNGNITQGAIYISPYSNKTYREVNTQFIEANTFYPITFEDPESNFSAEDIPDTQYALTGTDKTITLPYDEDVNWFIDSDGSTTQIKLTDISNDKKTATYTFKNVSKSIKLTTDGVADNEVAVAGYISINGAWTKVSSMKIKTNQATGDNEDTDRYYLTSADLKKLFDSYGFKASDYTKVSDENLSKYFPSSTIQSTDGSDNDTIQTDAGGEQSGDGTWQVNTIQLKNRENGIAVYYVPNITHVTGNSFEKTDKDVLADNRFYTISFEDASETFDSVPSTMYLRGGTVTITVPYQKGVTWTVLGKQKNDSSSKDAALYVKQEVSDGGDTADLTFNLHSDVTVTTATVSDGNEIKLEAYVSLNGTWTLIKDTGISRANWNGDHYYITEQELLDIYQSYGFTGLQAGTYHFGIATLIAAGNSNSSNDASMWPDQTLSTDSDGNRFLPLITNGFDKTGNVIKLYYVPNNTKTSSLSTENNKAPANDNAFYSITFEDKNNDFPNMDKTQKLVLNGKSTTIELPYKEGVAWKVTDKDGSLIRMDQTIDEKNGIVTIPIASVNKQLIITTGTASSETLASGKIAVNAYIAIDNAWVSVGTEWSYSNSKKAFIGDSNSFSIDDTQHAEFLYNSAKQDRYYLTVEQLENIFGSYGFKADSFTESNNTNIFPHNTILSDDGNIYADVDTMQIDSVWCVPFVKQAEGANGISIYYTPTPTDNRNSWSKTDTNLLEANSVFYTISAKDRMGVLQEETVSFPEAVQVKRKGSATYTLPKLESPYHWTAVNAHTGKLLSKGTTVTQDTDNQYTVSNIQEPVQFIISDSKKRISYDAQITREKLTNISSFARPEEQQIVTDGSIDGEKTKSFLIGDSFDGNYTILSPDSERAEVTLVESTHPRTFYYTFKGWQIDGTDIILQPGTELSELEDYQKYEQISLTAVWKAVDTNSRPTTVNFYVSLNCEIMDNTGTGVEPHDKDGFSESVYATRILGTEDLNQTIPWEDSSNSMFSIIAGDNSESAYDINDQLRQLVTTPVLAKENQGNASLTLESFPTDEEVLANLRDETGWNKGKTIELDGQTVSKEDLTTDNFTVRWYVLKYQSADAWHIDGVLVAKEAHAVVTKTFSGNQTAIDQVKDGYSISVTHEQTQTSSGTEEELATRNVTTDYTLVLEPKEKVEDTADEEKRGYDSYDEATNTYTWILTGRQDRQYTVTEHKYQAPEVFGEEQKYDGTYRYMIKNCTNDSTVENGVWKSYDGQGISLVAEAYPTDVSSSAYQTISFENRYVSSGDFTVQKIDSATQNGLKDVSFAISRTGTDEKDFTLWRKGNTSEYYLELEGDAVGEILEENDYMVVSKKILITDTQGYFYIHLPEGEYTLQETVPLGYKGASEITMTVSGGTTSTITNVTTTPEGNWAVIDGTNKAVLTIKNESRLLTTVTALKQWNENTKDEDKKSVVVELWRNDAPMGAQYRQTLSEVNNWQYQWKNLPLFIDGAVAKYSLREVRIGGTAYDADADSDGYADYNVSYDSAKYCESESRPQNDDGTVDTSQFTKQTATWQNDDLSEQHYANHALLVVNNSLAKGYISFRKLDGINQPLAGAEFTLYSNEACTTEVATAISQSDSTVQFDAQPAGTYYMKETKAPDGYSIDETVYTVTVSDVGTVRITKPSAERDDTGAVDTVMSIINHSARKLTLKKVSSTSGVQPLAGATFTIARDNQSLGTFTTDSDGTTNFGGLTLDDGEYIITETKAPSGYKKLGEHIDIVVKNGAVTAGTHGSTDDWKLEISGNSCILTVKNAPESNGALPSTGGYGILLPIVFGSALMCGASALALWLRKRRKNG